MIYSCYLWASQKSRSIPLDFFIHFCDFFTYFNYILLFWSFPLWVLTSVSNILTKQSTPFIPLTGIYSWPFR